MSKASTGIRIDLELHVLPVLHLARMAIALEDALREVDESRKILPGLHEHLKALGCMTDIGQSIAPHADTAILSAIHLIEAYDSDMRAGGVQ